MAPARDFPHQHPISDFTTVGDIFSAATNPEREKPFDIRTVMRAVVDRDHVIGGTPAAAVAFAREVTSRTSKGPRLAELEAELTTEEGRQAQIRLELAGLRTAVRPEKLGEVAEEFEQVHNIERARAVGSVDAIIPARDLRPYLVGAVELGMSRVRR